MVKINEFADAKLGYDIVEDAAIYMRNNPLFYRQHYFPAMTKCQDAHRLGKKVDMANIIKPITIGLEPPDLPPENLFIVF